MRICRIENFANCDDRSLPDLERQQGLEHFWDGLGDNKLGAELCIKADFTDSTARII
jgi:hypothetical protein